MVDTRDGKQVLVDSKEEILVYKWLLEAQKLGIVKDFRY